jgi:chromosome segregation ATPase
MADNQENPVAVTPPAKKPKLSYRFLRPVPESEAEIMTQRAMLRQETQGAYSRMAFSMKAAELVRMAFSYFSRIEAVLGKDIQRRLVDIDKELDKIDKEAAMLQKRKKNPKVVAELAELREKANAFHKQGQDLKAELKTEQDEFIDIMDQFQKFSSRLEGVRARNIDLTRGIEEEVSKAYHAQRKVRFAKKKKKEATKPFSKGTERELLVAASLEIQTAEKSKKSAVVKKNEPLPPGFKPLDR